MSHVDDMISIIIPVYNKEKTIRKCLDSLLNQSYSKEYEIIVVDDGSNDRTKEIVEKFERVKLLKQEHKGPASARNLGAKQAKGEIILFTDADCIADKHWAKEMVKPFENPEIVGVQGRYETKQKELIARFSQLEIEDRYERMKTFETIDFIGSYSAGYRKGVFLKSGGFDESFPIASGEDPELSFRLSKEYKMVFNPNAKVYHEHPNTLGKYLKQKFWRAYWRVLLYRKHPRKIRRESYTPQILKIQIGLFYLMILLLILSLFSTNSIYVFLSLFILLCLSTLPFSVKIFKKDKKVGLVSPVIIILRTIVFGIGLIYGFVRNIK
jgi:glycosyltransferase involved in cell wall biosynthesis